MSDSIQRAHDLISQGDRRGARRLLREALQANPRQPRAWALLAELAEDPDERLRCLQQLLRLEPGNDSARAQIETLLRRTPTPGGMPRPIFDTREQQRPEGVLIEPLQPDVPAPPPTPYRHAGPATLGLLVAGGLVLLLFVAMLAFVWSRGQIDPTPTLSPSAAPTLIPVRLALGDCVVNGGSGALLDFRNDTPLPLTILRGPAGSEEALIAMEPGSVAEVATTPGERVRYAVFTSIEGFSGGGALFEVQSGTTCTVSVMIGP